MEGGRGDDGEPSDARGGGDSGGDDATGRHGDGGDGGDDAAGGDADSGGTGDAGDAGDGASATDSPIDEDVTTTATPAITSGDDHSCALLTDATVECWGENAYGQLGSGSATGPDTCMPDLMSLACATAAVKVSGLKGVIAVAAGSDHTCALISNGTVECWGVNNLGQLGNGTATGHASCLGLPCETAPVAVSGLTNATAISAGGDFTCALLSGGTVKCWGDNELAELGAGGSTGPDTCGSFPCAEKPIAVAGLSGVEAISAGDVFACALLSGGTVECWGYNDDGELGNGTSTGPDACGTSACGTSPALVSGLTGVAAISAASNSACALLSGGTVKCWGDNLFGAVGDGSSTGPATCKSTDPCATTPVAVPGLSGVTALSGGLANCALLTGGTVECWGTNEDGELGTGTTGPGACGAYACSTAPVVVTGLTGVTSIAAGNDHVCVIASGGAVECWGYNALGDVGDGTSTGPDTCGSGPCAAAPAAVTGL